MNENKIYYQINENFKEEELNRNTREFRGKDDLRLYLHFNYVNFLVIEHQIIILWGEWFSIHKEESYYFISRGGAFSSSSSIFISERDKNWLVDNPLKLLIPISPDAVTGFEYGLI